jgi:hypothetical protein
MASGYYPPGVTGNEYAISGPDYEQEIDGECPHCGESALMEIGYRHEAWVTCTMCGKLPTDPLSPERQEELFNL